MRPVTEKFPVRRNGVLELVEVCCQFLPATLFQAKLFLQGRRRFGKQVGRVERISAFQFLP